MILLRRRFKYIFSIYIFGHQKYLHLLGIIVWFWLGQVLSTCFFNIFWHHSTVILNKKNKKYVYFFGHHSRVSLLRVTFYFNIFAHHTIVILTKTSKNSALLFLQFFRDFGLHSRLGKLNVFEFCTSQKKKRNKIKIKPLRVIYLLSHLLAYIFIND